MKGIFILLGTNLGDRTANLSQALRMLNERVGEVRQSSPVYATAAWGMTDQPDFLNQVVEMKTELPPRKLLQTLLQIEQDMGRVRKVKWGERLIDLDILYYDDQKWDEPDLQIPHPGIPYRRFTLVPLVDLSAEGIHPTLHQTQHELLAACADESEVRQVSAS